MNKLIRGVVYKNKVAGYALGKVASSFQFRLLSFYKEPKVVGLIKAVKKEVDFAVFPIEAYQIYSIARSQSKIEGDIAEVGVYQGGSAKIICEAKGEKILRLFDTFTGLPPVSDVDIHFGMKYWKEQQFNNTSAEAVSKYLSKYKNVILHKGIFPESSEPVRNTKFSFVHLDVDLYKSTSDSLAFFYPRLVKGGVILTHDYHSTGVHRAFDEFFGEKNVPLIEMPSSQCMVVRTDN